MKRCAVLLGMVLASPALASSRPYAVVDTNQSQCYDDQGRTGCANGPAGQDAAYKGLVPNYRDNGDGTVSDLNTGLMWQRDFDRAPWSEATARAQAARTGGHGDWRVPTIKELYSLMDFSGATGSAAPSQAGAPSDARPYLNTRVFGFEYPSVGRFIDAQYISSTAYLGTVMGRERAFFGVNFADGRIKGYPQDGGPGKRQWYLRLVRGNPDYGKNDFHDNGDGTVTDRATGLAWGKADSGRGMNWAQALGWCETLTLGGHADWRLPNAKELHSIVDYSRSPDSSGSAAIDPIFQVTPIRDEEGGRDWPYFWTSTSHLDGRRPGDFAVYVAFGRALGYLGGQGQGMGGMGMGPPPMGGGMGMSPPGMGPGMGPPPMAGGGGGGRMTLTDVHGAGAQRSSPKSGDESRLPKGAGPQGDVLRINNFARCVRG